MDQGAPYSKIEYTFLTENIEYTSLPLSRRVCYLSIWSYAVYVRKDILTRKDIMTDVARFYKIDTRTLSKTLKYYDTADSKLIKRVDGGYRILGVKGVHNKLQRWNGVEKTTKAKKKPIVSKYPFEIFWGAYDKKAGRDKCSSYWQGRVSLKNGSKITEKDRTLIMKAVPLYVASTPEKKFRKDPSTYLYNSCWLDEIINAHELGAKPTEYKRFN